jgi:hypothetical protein
MTDWDQGQVSRDQDTGKTQLPTRHRLLPHERWFARLALERQRARRTANVPGLDQTMGPEGFTLFAAAIATGIPASFTACVGIVLMVASEGRGLLFEVAGWVTYGGAVALAAVALPRAVQARRVAQAFRGSSPFSRA